MKTIGLIGGMSWESTASYYTTINQQMKNRLGGLHSAKVILVSVDFAEIETLQRQGEWQKTAEILGQAAKSLQKAGADFFLICTNTMHIVANEIQQYVSIPLLHIADSTAAVLVQNGVTKVGLLGTNFTMEKPFYKHRLQQHHGIDVLVPTESDRQLVHKIIYDELCLGTINTESRNHYIGIMESLISNGAEGIILGCTEIALLVDNQHTNIKLFDTAFIHANAAVEEALES